MRNYFWPIPLLRQTWGRRGPGRQLLVGLRKAQLAGSYGALHMAQQLLRHDLIRSQQVRQQAPQLQLLAPVNAFQ